MDLIPCETLGVLRGIVNVMDSKAAALVQIRKQAIEHGDLDAMENSNDIMSLLRELPVGSTEHITNELHILVQLKATAQRRRA